MQSAIINRLITASLAALLFGIAYNAVVSHLEKRGYHEGYLAFLVAMGTFTVLAASAFVVLPLNTDALIAIIVCGVLFGAAGLPMIIGSIERHVRARERERQALEAEARRRTSSEEEPHP